MRLQIKKMEGPDEIQFSNRQENTYTGAVATAAANNRFTCYFNRDVTDEDFLVNGVVTPLRVHIHILEDEGNRSLRPTELNITRNNINNDNNFCFTLNVNFSVVLSGSCIYVQALLRNRVTATQYITVSDTNKSHETFKKVLLYSQKTINHVYWSNNEVIDINCLEEEENPRTEDIRQNEDAFLHIKTVGMYNDWVQVKLATEQNGFSKSAQVRLNQNHKVVAFNMENIIAEYRIFTNNPIGAVNISLRVTVTYPNQNQLFYSYMMTGQLPVLPRSTAAALNIVMEDRTPPARRTSTGTVYVNVNLDEPQPVTPTGYTDFMLGYMCHLLSNATIHEGVSQEHVRNKPLLLWSAGGVARYPFRFYELWLSDLVACGVVSPEDARILTLDRDNTTLRSAAVMVTYFNKYQVFAGQSMLQRLANGNTIDTDIIVKILNYVSREDGRGINRLYEVCRDAWQQWGNGASAVPTTRYAHNGSECPPGGYTINFSGPTFEVYFSNQIAISSTAITQPERTRTGLAIHRGDAYSATGCTTLYTAYSDREAQYSFLEFMFRSRDLTNRPVFDRRRLNLAYIEERNAQRTQNYHNRWYDIIAPFTFISGITGPDTVVGGENAVYTLVINKRSLAPNDIIASEEKESIRWQINTGSGYQNLDADGLETVTIAIEPGWVGRTITVKAYADLSMGDRDNATKGTAVRRRT